MRASYREYPNYKDSGIEWVGDIPKHWNVKPVFAVCSEKEVKNSLGEESNVLSLSYGRIVPRNVEDNYGLMPESFNTYQIVLPGDVVLRLTDLQNDKRSLRVGLVNEKGIITSAYLCLRSGSKLLPAFLYALLHSYDTTKVFYGMGGGLRQSMKFADMRRMPLLTPPLEEQKAIVAYIAHETAKIDRLIEKQQRLVELLKEKRQAVISHAVTKGLDANVKIRDSGVEWLGKIPDHWIACSLKYVFRNEDYKRVPLSAEERGGRQGEFPYYGASGVIDHIDDYIFDEPRVLVGEDGANLLMRSTSLAYTAEGRYWVNNHAHILKPIDDNTKYWAEVIELVDVTPLVSGSAQPKLTAEALGNLKICFSPDKRERRQLQEYVVSRQSKIDELITKANKTIDLFRERRIALISAAVTGKIDVRNWRIETQSAA